MSKMKKLELLLLAVSLIVSVAKSFVKFIERLKKAKRERAFA